MISIVYNVERYRKLLSREVKKGDIVIELGPHIGRGTLSYIDGTRLTVTVDKSSQSENAFEEIKGRCPNLRFVRGDVRSFETIEKVLKLTRRCDLMAIDIGGGRFPDTVFKVWATWSGIFKPRDSIIRNRGIAEFVQRAEVRDDSIKRKFEDDGWLSEWGRAMPHKLKKQLDEFGFWVDLGGD
ncbi:MAG: hypothetical protein B6U86_04745 [Candidatus Altiarchaeales archaeon ex4484_43]|nr:MAG: hypothetical protein B6U86_04745 [Candidatus Altiarchaeales archaeon ex4484_43]RLI89952.1 MAG: hypothetical protein DRO62_00455 [Candidatus Altiarchaeales archaeon]